MPSPENVPRSSINKLLLISGSDSTSSINSSRRGCESETEWRGCRTPTAARLAATPHLSHTSLCPCRVVVNRTAAEETGFCLVSVAPLLHFKISHHSFLMREELIFNTVCVSVLRLPASVSVHPKHKKNTCFGLFLSSHQGFDSYITNNLSLPLLRRPHDLWSHCFGSAGENGAARFCSSALFLLLWGRIALHLRHRRGPAGPFRRTSPSRFKSFGLQRCRRWRGRVRLKTNVGRAGPAWWLVFGLVPVGISLKVSVLMVNMS